MKILQLLMFIMCLAVNNIAIGDYVANEGRGGLTMPGAFGLRDKYLNDTALGNPDDIKDFEQNKGDTSNLQNLSQGSLASNGSNALKGSEAGHFLQNSAQKRDDAVEEFKINPEASWLKDSLKIEQDPTSHTGGGGEGGVSSSETVIEIKKSCIEGVEFNVDVTYDLIADVTEENYLGPVEYKTLRVASSTIPTHWWLEPLSGQRHISYIYTINQQYHEEIVKFLNDKIKAEFNEIITVPKQNIIANTAGQAFSSNITWGGDREVPRLFTRNAFYTKSWVIFHYNSQKSGKRVVLNGEYWQVATEEAEGLVAANSCYETSRMCTSKGKRTFAHGYELDRPCWSERVSYKCKSEPENGCDYLVNQGCRLEDSECDHKIGGVCMRWKRNFTCFGKKKKLNYSAAGSGIFCLGGDCHSPTIGESDNFSNVAYLAALNAAKDDCMKSPSGICTDPINIFPGEINGCRKIATGAINCCTSMKGWANGPMLKCKAEEKSLALKKEKGNCHEVGTFCHERFLKKCIVKKTHYCCYASKLSRIFQEQAKLQGILDWGNAENPNCRALTLEEFVKIDFSKINLEELFDGFLKQGQSNAKKVLPAFIPNKVPDMQHQHMTDPSSSGNIENKGL